MAIEIERKFLVISEGWRPHVAGRKRLRQAYLARQGKAAVRVRMVDDASATLAIKSRGARTSRLEYEYPIPVEEALSLIELRDGALLSKVRHIVPWGAVTWEVDVFEGENAGLIIAEVELAHEQQALDLPPWVGREITHDERYYNSRLVHLPFCHFPADDAAPQERVG
jgi:adenylate cyclase